MQLISDGRAATLNVLLTGALAALVAGAVVITTEDAQAAEPDPATYACEFQTGTSRLYIDHAFKAAPAKPLRFKVESIDFDTQSARLETEVGTGPLRIVRAVGATHFLEVVAEGFLNITTIYAFDPKQKSYPAVHSRHIGLLGEPIVAQYVGFCKGVAAAAPAAANSAPDNAGVSGGKSK